MHKYEVEFKNGTYTSVEAGCMLDAVLEAVLIRSKTKDFTSKMFPVRVWIEETSYEVNNIALARIMD